MGEVNDWVLGWYFIRTSFEKGAPNGLCAGYSKPEDGVIFENECGEHRPYLTLPEALDEAESSVLCRVQFSLEGTQTKILWRMDVTEVLWEFIRTCQVRKAMYFRAPQVVLTEVLWEFIRTCQVRKAMYFRAPQVVLEPLLSSPLSPALRAESERPVWAVAADLLRTVARLDSWETLQTGGHEWEPTIRSYAAWETELSEALDMLEDRARGMQGLRLGRMIEERRAQLAGA